MDTSEGSSIISTLIFAGVITLAVYFLIIGPLLPRNNNHRQAAPAAASANQQQQQANQDSKNKSTKKASRVPCHVSEPSARIAHAGGSNILGDGMVAFRHTKASIYEQDTLSSTQQRANRTDRAKILAKLLLYTETGSCDAAAAAGTRLTTVLQTPPAKGSTLILSIPAEQVGCSKLQRVLYLLGTYYNAIIIIGISSSGASQPDRSKLIQQLRGRDGSLPTDVIPDHRIMLASTATGRIALARQIERVELMLDYDTEVETQLRRFKLKAITYGRLSGMAGRTGSSVLGNELLS